MRQTKRMFRKYRTFLTRLRKIEIFFQNYDNPSNHVGDRMYSFFIVNKRYLEAILLIHAGEVKEKLDNDHI